MGEGETAMHNWKKFAKRVMAGALCAACLASVWPSGLVAMAAPGDDNSMRIEYVGHKQTDTIKDDPLGLYIMVDRWANVQLHYDKTDTMPSGDPLDVEKYNGGTEQTAYEGQFFDTNVESGGIATSGTAKITAIKAAESKWPTDAEGKQYNIDDYMETFSISGRFNSITKEGNYTGSISGDTDKDAELITKIPMSLKSEIKLTCVKDEDFTQEPQFVITGVTGNFEPYRDLLVSEGDAKKIQEAIKEGTDKIKFGNETEERSFKDKLVLVYPNQSVGIPSLNNTNKTAYMRIPQPGSGLQRLEFRVPQVYTNRRLEIWDYKQKTYVEYVLKAGATPGLESSYMTWEDANKIKTEQSEPDYVYQEGELPQGTDPVPNNFFRSGKEYTLSFVPLTTQPRYLYIATANYVLNSIEKEMKEDQRLQDNYKYFEFEGTSGKADSLALVSGDSFKIKMTKRTFDYDFPITWQWKPETVEINGEEKKIADLDADTQKKAQNVISDAYLRRVNGTDENTITFSNTNKDDLRMEGDVKGKLIATVTCDFAEQKTRTVEFDITISGKGTKAGIKAHSTWTGTEDGLKKTLLSNQPDYTIFEEPTALYLDTFSGGLKGYTPDNQYPHEYVFHMTMGKGNGMAEYALVTFDLQPTEEDGDQTEGAFTPADLVELALRSNIETENYSEVGDSTGGIQIVSSTPTQLQVRIDNNLLDNKNENERNLVVRGKIPKPRATATLKMSVEYHKTVNGVDTVDTQTKLPITITVVNNTPADNAALKELRVENKRPGSKDNEQFPVEILPNVWEYSLADAGLPYGTDGYIVKAWLDDTENNVPVYVWATEPGPSFKNVTEELFGKAPHKVTDLQGRQYEALEVTPKELRSNGGLPFKIKDENIDLTYTLHFLVRAQDLNHQREYTLKVRRNNPNTDDKLASLLVSHYDPDNPTQIENLITNFDPNTREYLIENLPYSTNYLRVRAESSSQYADAPEYNPQLIKLAKEGKEFLDMKKDLPEETVTAIEGYVGAQLPCLTVTVKSEADVTNKVEAKDVVYRVFFKFAPPSEEASLTNIQVSNAADTNATPAALPYTPAFGANNPGPYRMTETNALPYTTERIRLQVTPADPKVSKIEVSVNSSKPFEIKNYQVPSDAFTLQPHSDTFMYNRVVITVTAEDGKTTKTYSFEIERSPARDDSDLVSLVLTDGDDTPITETYFQFHRDETNYKITLPFDTRYVKFQPTLSDPNGHIKLKDSGNPLHNLSDTLGNLLGDPRDTLTSGELSKRYDLNEPGNPRTFTITAIAEDNRTSKSYVLEIDREKPSKDALLKNLTATNVTEDGLDPIFKPTVTQYTGTMAEGQNAIIVTPTAKDPNATIRVDGEVVASGTASQPIDILEEHQYVIIEVTAQDGETTMTYSIDVFNQNLVEKSSNADLKSLTFSTGLLTPKFQPAVVEYELAVKEDVYSINIIPEPDDPMAEMKVLSGSRELGDFHGNFAMALKDGQNDIKIQVTSPDKTVTKEYNIKVYRNKEDSLKNLTPLKAADIDFTKAGNPITISLVEYPRIQADVFTELRDKYPEKTLVLQGVDYSLTFNAATLDTIIPQRQIYDFSMSFSSPNAEDVYRFAEQWPENDDILSELVLIYFDYHGDLPGPATLNLSLSNRYGAQNLFWHYYNEERDRTDYYGVVQPNAKGTFAVAIDHFSTYVVSRVHSIVGAENQEGNISFIQSAIAGAATNNAAGGSNGGTGGSPTSSSGKLNPATLAEQKSRKVIP